MDNAHAMEHTLDKTIKSGMNDLLRTMKKMRTLDPDIALPQILVFFFIASRGDGCTQTEVRDYLGMASATASRNIAALSKVHRLGKEGLGVIDWKDDVLDRRVKRLALTSKGRQFLIDLLDIDA